MSGSVRFLPVPSDPFENILTFYKNCNKKKVKSQKIPI
jgi:hypothetical protein